MSMSELTPSKLKVVELRAELQTRGLDTKGNKAVLVQRLEEALKSEEEEAEVEKDEVEHESDENESNSNDKEIAQEVEQSKPIKDMNKDPKVEKEASESVIEPVDLKPSNVTRELRHSDSRKNENRPLPAGKEASPKDLVSPPVSVSTEASVKSTSSSPTKVQRDPVITQSKPEDKSSNVQSEQLPISVKPKPETPTKTMNSSHVSLEVVPSNVPAESSETNVAATVTNEDAINKPELTSQESKTPVNVKIEDQSSLSAVKADKKPQPTIKTEGNSPVITPSETPVEESPDPVVATIKVETPVAPVEVEQSNSAPVEVSADDNVRIEPSESNNRKRKRSASRSPPRNFPPPAQKVKRKDAHIEDRNFENTADVEEKGTVLLDPYNSDLNLIIDKNGYVAEPLYREGFAFMWAGARSTHGIETGKICFEVKLQQYLEAQLPADEMNPHVLRIGFSVDDTSMQLGEEPLSYGFGGTGKASTNCRFKDYGQPFVEGDVVSAFLDMEKNDVQISFGKNGQHLGIAYTISKSELKNEPLFPHILTKNVSFEVNFGQMEEPYFKNPSGYEEFEFINNVALEKRVRGSLPPPSKADCEMIMMCGLPGAGKTTWALEHSQKNPKKKYYILGTNNIIDKMKVMGLPRKRNYSGRWDALIQMSTRCLNKLFEIASKARRNYILDQTNVYPSAQIRKMRNFQQFKRLAVVIVPTDEEFQSRVEKRVKEEGTDIPDSAVLEMKANFGIPRENDLFDEVLFPELHRQEALELVKKYNTEGLAVVGNRQKRQRLSDTAPSWGSPAANQVRSDRGHDRRETSDGWSRNRDSGGGGYQRGGYQNQHSNSGGYQSRGGGGYQQSPRSGYQNQRGGGGGGGYQNQRGGGGGYNQRSGSGGSRDNSQGGFGRGGRDRGFSGGGRGGNRDNYSGGGRGGNRDNYSGGGGGGNNRDNYSGGAGGNRDNYSGGAGGGGYNRDSSSGYRNSPSGVGGNYSGGNKSQGSYGNHGTNWNQQQQGYSGQNYDQSTGDAGYNQQQQSYNRSSSYQASNQQQQQQQQPPPPPPQQQQQQDYSGYGQTQATNAYGQQTAAYSQTNFLATQQQQQQQQQQYINAQWNQQANPAYQSYYSGYQQN